jgi:hypothetical protein
MAISNRHRVGRALDQLRDGLLPYILRANAESGSGTVPIQVCAPRSCHGTDPPLPSGASQGTQGLGGWLEGLEFGLDFGFGEAHFL